MTERIKVNPEKPPERGRYLDVEGPDEEGMVRVTEVETAPGWPPDTEYQIFMHTRDWCVLFDWWACNIWGMEGDEDGESTAETDQPGPPQAEGE